MAEEPGLPRGLCRLCSEETIAAIHLRQLAADSQRQWEQAVHAIAQINDPKPQDKVIYIFYSNGFAGVVHDPIGGIAGAKDAYTRLTGVFGPADELPKVRAKRHKPYKPRTMSCHCPECGRRFSNAHDLSLHLKKSSKRACVVCATITDKEKLSSHMQKAHGRSVKHCPLCYEVFESDELLEDHRSSVHRPDTVTCAHCGESFTSERALRAHMYVHTLFHCDSCIKSFENRKCFKYHKKQCRRDVPERPPSVYTCDHCGNNYNNKPSLRIHIIQKHLNVLPFVCSTCGKRTSTLAHLKSHQAVHAATRLTLQCAECGAKMRTELGYALHQRIHTGEKPYACDECGDRFLSASRRLDHIKRRHRSAEDMAHGCPECPARFVRPFELRKHVKFVHDSQIFEESLCPKGVCVSCVSATLSAYEHRCLVRNSEKLWQDTLTALTKIPSEVSAPVRTLYCFLKDDDIHILKNYSKNGSKTIINRLKTLKNKRAKITRKPRVARAGPTCTCFDCGKVFSSPHYLNVHLQNSAQKQACLICGAIVIRGKGMQEHLSSCHDEVSHICAECPSIFPTVEEVAKHMRLAHQSGAYTCNDCGRTFPRESSFEAHQQMHAVRTCRSCGCQFANRGCYREHRAQCEPDAKPETSSLRRDLRSNVRDPATYICDYCNKTYHSRPQLKNHIIWIHMNIRPHQCQWCGKRFYTSARLAEHSVVHTRIRNFACDICGARLVTKMAMVYHKRRHTGEKPYECGDCGERFISASRRSEHAKRRHGKGAMFYCTLCPSHFVRGHELRKHVDKVHKNASEIDKSILSKVKSSVRAHIVTQKDELAMCDLKTEIMSGTIDEVVVGT